MIGQKSEESNVSEYRKVRGQKSEEMEDGGQ